MPPVIKQMGYHLSAKCIGRINQNRRNICELLRRERMGGKAINLPLALHPEPSPPHTPHASFTGVCTGIGHVLVLIPHN